MKALKKIIDDKNKDAHRVKIWFYVQPKLWYIKWEQWSHDSEETLPFCMKEKSWNFYTTSNPAKGK